MKTTRTQLAQTLRWLGIAVLALLPVLMQSNQASSGPGLDSAVEDARNADMCSALPPFLNVSITEKPNIMIMYDNASSMSLAAYTRPYDPRKEYYGLFDNRACYKGTSFGFDKNPIFGLESTTVGGVWEVNPAWETNANRESNAKGPDGSRGTLDDHNCDAGSYADSSYPFSGNFLNWATMRRIDLLRKAFTGGLSNNSGTQQAQYLAGEGTQTGGADKFAPCFSKSYSGNGVSPYGLNQLKVVDGTVTWGAQCGIAEETILASTLRVPVDYDGVKGEYAFSPKDRVVPASPTMPPTLEEALAAWKAGERNRNARLAQQPAPVFVPPLQNRTERRLPLSGSAQVASLFDVMSDAGFGLLSAPPRADFVVTLSALTATSGYEGDSLGFTVEIKNIGTDTGTALVSFYLERDGTRYLAGVCSAGSMAAGTVVAGTCFLTVPTVGDLDEDYLVVAVMDAAGSVAELDETNNESYYGGTYRAIAPSGPDFVILGATPDLHVGRVGMPVTVVFQVRNQGDLAGLATTITLTFGTVDAAASCAVPALAAGASAEVTCSFAVPTLTTGASYALRATIDPTDAQVERKESNNEYPAGDFWVYDNATTGSKKSLDLQAVAVVIDDGSLSGVPGGTELVEITIANVGSLTVAAGADLLLVLSSDNTFTTGDLNVASCSALPEFKPYPDASWKQTVTCTATFPNDADLPLKYPSGSYLAAIVNPSRSPTESPDYASNAIGTRYFIEYSDPDLVISNLVASPSTGLSPGDTITVTVDVTNQGAEVKFADIEIIGSGNAVRGDFDDVTLVVGPAECNGDAHTLTPGQTVTLNCSITVPLSALTGTYYLFARVDPSATASPAESDTSNNIRSIVVGVGAVGILPDLVITNVGIPSKVSPGGVLEVSYRIENIGFSTTATYPTVRLRMEADSGLWVETFCTTNVLVAPGVPVDATCSVSVPGETGSPAVTNLVSYAVGLQADPGAVILEGDETNNVSTGSVTVERLTACTSGCDYVLKVDYDNLGRTGILWSFRKKALGTLAPANLGIATINDWSEDTGLATTDKWQITMPGKFFGIEENQQNSNNLIPHLEAAGPKYSGKLARTLLNVMKYYAREPNFVAGKDPMKYDPVKNTEYGDHKCRNNYVLMISDGYSFDDNDALPPHVGSVSDLKDYASDATDVSARFHGDTPITMDDGTTYDMSVPWPSATGLITIPDGSYHVDNVARWGHDVDLRSDLSGNQTVGTVVVHTFAFEDVKVAQSERATQLMRLTAIQGGYIERDSVDGPSRQDEWDLDRNGLPDNYFAAREGDDIGEIILNALNSILLKTASGTSVSVIASTARGEGAIYQSYFRPTTAEAGTEITWLGYLQALWVDRFNNLREDTDGDGALSMADDMIISYEFDQSTLETIAKLYNDDDADGVADNEDPTNPGMPDPDNPDVGPIPLTKLKPIFESGLELFHTAQEDRNIFTWPHWATDAAPSASYPVMDVTGDASSTNIEILSKHMWPGGNDYYGSVTMTSYLVQWLRGEHIPWTTFRNRRITIDGTQSTWKLGDIVYSTPTIVGPPEERYDLIYADRSYGEYFTHNNVRNRRRLVLIGSNGGMLHAFNGGVFRTGDNPATAKEEQAWYDKQGLELGQEVWAYVPGSLLPQLRILADAGYDTTCHIYYVDLKPKVTDVRIFFDEAGDPIDDGYHIEGWGTIMIGGMRLGCGDIQYASYFIIDITNPDSPTLLAELAQKTAVNDSSRSLDADGLVKDLSGLNFTYFYPVVMRVPDPSANRFDPTAKWYLVVGSGPDEIAFNNSNSKAGNTALYVFDLNKIALAPAGSVTPGGKYKALEDFSYAVNKFDNGTFIANSSAGVGGVVVSGGLTADLSGNYSVDTVYVVAQYDDRAASTDNARWGSEIWRLVPKNPDGTTIYWDNPKNWTLTKVFATRDPANPAAGSHYQPIQGAPGITRDQKNNIWLYMGTGRFVYRNATHTAMDDLSYGLYQGVDSHYQQSLYGVIDPCWNDTNEVGCPTTTSPYRRSSLVNVTGLITRLIGDTGYVEDSTGTVNTTGRVMAMTVCGSPTCTIPEVRNYVGDTAAGRHGWVRDLQDYDDSGALGAVWWEVSFNKPAVAGGIVLFTTYLPGYDNTSEACALGGQSFLYALDYMSGVAPSADVFGTSETSLINEAAYRTAGDAAPPSPPAIYNKVVFVQSATARPIAVETNAQFKLFPHIRSWEEQ